MRGVVKYVVQFDSNGGNNIDNKVVPILSLSDLPDEQATFETPKREGYEFLGWYTNKSFDKKISNIKDASIPFEDKYLLNGCFDGKYVTLYANWKKLDAVTVDDTGLSINKTISYIAFLIVVGGVLIVNATLNDKRKEEKNES